MPDSTLRSRIPDESQACWNLKLALCPKPKAAARFDKVVVLIRFAFSSLCLVLMTRASAQDAGVARLTAGLEQSAAGSTAPVQKLSVRFFFTEPLKPRLSRSEE